MSAELFDNIDIPPDERNWDKMDEDAILVEATRLKLHRLRLKDGDIVEVREEPVMKAIREILESPWESPDNIIFLYAPKGIKRIGVVDATRILGEIAATHAH